MPNSTKVLIAIVSILILGSGIFVFTKSRPVENPSVTVASSSATAQVPSIFKSVLPSSLQVVSSSSQSESVKVVEAPKLEVPKVELPKVETIQPKPQPETSFSSFKLFYQFNDKNKSGGQAITNSDINFLNENIQDIADYYFQGIENFFSNNDKIITVYKFQKSSSNIYFIELSMQINPPSGEGSISYPNRKTYKFTKINLHDGNFEEVENYSFTSDLQSIDTNTTNQSNAETYTDKNNPQKIDSPGQFFHD